MRVDILVVVLLVHEKHAVWLSFDGEFFSFYIKAGRILYAFREFFVDTLKMTGGQDFP